MFRIFEKMLEFWRSCEYFIGTFTLKETFYVLKTLDFSSVLIFKHYGSARFVILCIMILALT